MKVSIFYHHILEASEQTGKPVLQLLKEARAAGIAAVEMDLAYLTEHWEVCDLLEQADLKISCIYGFYEMDSKDETELAKKHVAAAVRVGAGRILVVPGFLTAEEAQELKPLVMDYDKTAAFLEGNVRAKRMAEGLSMAAELGAASGVQVTIEDFDDEKSPISSASGMLWYIRQIPQLKATFDTGNFIIHGEKVTEAWELLQEDAVHVHLKDRGENAVAVGDGYIPIKEVVERFEERQYDGYYAIEHFGAENQEQCMLKSAAFLKQF